MTLQTAPKELALLKSRLREINSLRSAYDLLYWDQATYLPKQGSDARGEQLSHLKKLTHELSTSKELGQWLEALGAYSSTMDSKCNDACLLRVTREDFERDTKLPADFQAEAAAHASRSFEAWKKARAANDFGLVQGVLEKTLDISRRTSEYLSRPTHSSGHSSGPSSVLDPLIDLEDPGFTVAMIRPMFVKLRARLVPLLDRLIEAGPPPTNCVQQHFPAAEQIAFGEKLIRAIGYDFERGRQDLTHHPFMTRISHSDVRITTRVKENDLTECLFSTIHEAGHALYELGIDPSLDGTPLARGSSSGIHESQSRLWENIVGRSLPFWERFFPDLQKAFPKQLGTTSLQEFHQAINAVNRGLIRTDADEVTYNLHVMIRFDLECDLLEGRLAVRDLPEAWNARYQSDLGLVPPTLSEGVLQDVHWYHGLIGGVFQSYTIGNVLSGQLFEAARRARPQLDEDFRTGNFAPLRDWLKTELHWHGRKFEGPTLIKNSTGHDLDSENYLSYLERKYAALAFRR